MDILFILYLFLEGKEGEREGKKHQCVVASPIPPTGDLACNPGMFPRLGIESKGRRPALNPLSHTSQGGSMDILMMLILPTHEYNICFHLFVSSSIYFFSVL